jgi:hypothetical protein
MKKNVSDLVIVKRKRRGIKQKMIGFRLPMDVVEKLERNGIEINKTAAKYLMTIAENLK